ncbi:hypothetical protein GCM10009855_08360 [Gordonia cholesterolivorans]|uniref:Uncharacterized protein n=1 Tax=Gordonia cholesterolivorans TaxID=559625 RepID=A0ABN3H7C4_9ACTN
MVDQLGGVHVAAAHRPHVRHQLCLSAFVVHPEGRDEVDVRMSGEDRVDLPELDAQAAHLDLEVRTADVLQFEVGVRPHQIAGAVHPVAGSTDRVRHETSGGQCRLRVVTASQTGAGHVQFADRSHRHRTQILVEHQQAGAADRSADGHRASRDQRVGAGGHDGGLGGTVGVEHLAAGSPAGDEVVGDGFASEHQDLGTLAQPLGVHGGQRRRCEEDVAQ